MKKIEVYPEPSLMHTSANAKNWIIAGGVVLTLTFIVLATWLILVPLAAAVIASGVVKVDSNHKSIQHREGGIVKEIFVHNGDRVQAGQVLAVLEDQSVNANLNIVVDHLDIETAKAARLRAERDTLKEISFPPQLRNREKEQKILHLLRAETRSFQKKKHVLHTQSALLTKQIEALNREVTHLHRQVQADQVAKNLAEQELGANESLAESGLVPQVVVLRLRRTVEDYRARAEERWSSISRTQQQIADLELRRHQLISQSIAAAAEELSRVEAKIGELENRLRPVQDAVRRQQLLAPVNGRVMALKIFTVGGIINPGETIMEIVPENMPLVVEAKLRVEDIDNIQPGMTVDVQLSAYYTRHTPRLAGTVSVISPDRLLDQMGDVPYYLVYISVDKSSLDEVPHISLYPGMPCEVFIKIGSRSTLEYMLEPLTRSMRRAFRET